MFAFLVGFAAGRVVDAAPRSTELIRRAPGWRPREGASAADPGRWAALWIPGGSGGKGLLRELLPHASDDHPCRRTPSRRGRGLDSVPRRRPGVVVLTWRSACDPISKCRTFDILRSAIVPAIDPRAAWATRVRDDRAASYFSGGPSPADSTGWHRRPRRQTSTRRVSPPAKAEINNRDASRIPEVPSLTTLQICS
jgi:hypothetical protein